MFVKTPNLPKSRVTLMAVARQETAVIDSLNKLGIECLPLEPSEKLDKRISFHADMLMHHAGGNRVILSDTVNEKIMSENSFVNFLTIKEMKPDYPDDAIINCARIGNFMLGNKNIADSTVTGLCDSENIRFIHVKQGYTKCNTVVVDENSIITSDIGISKIAIKEGIEVLTIEAGDILLEGHPTGFIGGTCAFTDDSVIAFNGNPCTQNFYPMMEKFLSAHDVEIVSLRNGRLRDIGGMIPLKEIG